MRELYRGSQCIIAAPVNDGRCKVEEFLEGYRKKNQVGATRIAALLREIGDRGIHRLGPQVYEKITKGGGLFELKERGGLLRLLCFFDPNLRQVIVVASVFKKNPAGNRRSKQQQEKIEEAKKYMKSYKNNPLSFEEE